ncbi:MAG: geranylgeranyl reductase family protein [Actinomycetota bacterium]|nr:geranylgeranyl reductase family protein [Actinomycetota bacterium]
MISVDVAVVGAGPAGAAAATTAARLGLRVLLVDRAAFPRDKCCGDGLTTGALRRLEALGLDPQRLPTWEPVRTAHVRIPGGEIASLELPAGATYAATVQRVELDAALVGVARHAGVQVEDGCAVVGARPAECGSGVELELEGGATVRAWYAVAADGMWSPLRRALGLGEPAYLGEWHAVRQYHRRVGAAARDFWVWFEQDLQPGYAWSFPLPGGRANVGFGLRRTPGERTGSMKALWADLLARPHIAAVLGPLARAEENLKSWPIPARIGTTRLAALGGRVLFAGDAARAADCMTGEGIAQALETGELAARIAAASGPAAAGDAAAAYRAAIRRGMAIDDWLSSRFSAVLAAERGMRGWFRLANASAGSRRRFVHWMFEDYPRAGLITPWRWHRGFLHPPGPYPG